MFENMTKEFGGMKRDLDEGNEPCTALSPIEANIGTVRSLVQSVCQRVIVLEERISSVLAPEPPKASVPSEIDRFGTSPVCEDLHSIHLMLENLITDLEVLQDRVEL
jgi:hypothetical protein